MTAVAAVGAPGQGTTAASLGDPGGVVDGSKVIALLSAYWAGATPARTVAEMGAPAGWADDPGVAMPAFGSFYWLTSAWWEDADVADDGPYAFTATGAAGLAGYALRVTGATPEGESPFVDGVHWEGTTAANAVTFDPFTPGGDDSLLVALSVAGGAVSAPGWTKLDEDILTDDNVMGIHVLEQGAAAELTPTFTAAGAGGYIHVTIVTLRGPDVLGEVDFTATRVDDTHTSIAWDDADPTITAGVTIVRVDGDQTGTLDGSGDAPHTADFDPTTIVGAVTVATGELASPYVDDAGTTGIKSYYLNRT